MPANENMKNGSSIQEILGNLCKEMHPSSEMILAYVRSELSRENLSKIGKHIEGCNECAEILKLAKRTLDAEEGGAYQHTGSESVPPPSPRVAAKAKLASMLSARRDRLAEALAKLLLPQDSWYSIKPTIVVTLARQKFTDQILRDERGQLPAAAFSSGAGVDGTKDYETVVKVLDFVDLVHDFLLEQCETVADIESQLPICMDKAMVMLDDLNLDEETEREILKVLSEVLSADEA